MAIPVSSLSIALQALADFLDDQFGTDVIVTLDTPEKAAQKAKDRPKSVLNLFTYRLVPSGFHAEAGSGDPLFLRAQVLLTCFPNGAGTVLPDTDLRVLGHAVSVLHSLPTIPVVLPGPAPAGAGAEDFRTRNPVIYQMQAVLLAPQMEELNHIWTTQGSELAYRLSLAYELGLIPVEPLSRRVIAPPPTAAVLEVAPETAVALTAEGIVAPSAQPITRALRPTTGPGVPPVSWVPALLWPVAGGLATAQTVPAGTTNLPLALIGPPGARVAVRVTWTRADGTVAAQAPQVLPVAVRLDDAALHQTLSVENAAAGDRAEVLAFPADAGGVAIPGAPGGNVLTLTVGA